MTARHSPAQIAAFAAGESAQVVARDRRDAALVFLPRGQADSVRAVAVEHYECPIPGCDSPVPLSTRGGSKRDHFWHRRPHAHPGGPESLHHFQAKHLVAQWARAAAAAGGVEVAVNEEEWSSDVRRRPDVLATWPDGSRVAFEVEYKSFPVAAWRAKDDAYRAAGIVPVWLFGHTPERYLKPERRAGRARGEGEPPAFRLTAITACAAERGPVLFINPVLGLVGTLWDRGEDLETVRAEDRRWFISRGRRVGDPRAVSPNRDASFDLALSELRACALDVSRGLVTPTMSAIEVEARRVQDAAAADRVAITSAARAARASGRRAVARQVRSVVPAPPSAPGARCRVCGNELDPILAAAGRHVLC
ncbi:hypothetical protein HF998_04120 [Cellulomonas hominis]|uniref:competence protein CoiA family protein n=1 Tax=Cellulomonas hominis TaxID=156981 RepID=UPI0016BBE28F|nr:hypothetical protein [Cellulomonas hominis]